MYEMSTRLVELLHHFSEEASCLINMCNSNKDISLIRKQLLSVFEVIKAIRTEIDAEDAFDEVKNAMFELNDAIKSVNLFLFPSFFLFSLFLFFSFFPSYLSIISKNRSNICLGSREGSLI